MLEHRKNTGPIYKRNGSNKAPPFRLTTPVKPGITTHTSTSRAESEHCLSEKVFLEFKSAVVTVVLEMPALGWMKLSNRGLGPPGYKCLQAKSREKHRVDF